MTTSVFSRLGVFRVGVLSALVFLVGITGLPAADPEAVRGDYLRRFAEHAEQLTRACRELGVDYSEFTTNEPLELLLYDLLQARARRGRDVLRRAPSRGGAA